MLFKDIASKLNKINTPDDIANDTIEEVCYLAMNMLIFQKQKDKNNFEKGTIELDAINGAQAHFFGMFEKLKQAEGHPSAFDDIN